MVGLFINTLPARVRVPAAVELLPILKDLLARQIEASEYQHSPLVQVQGWSDAPPGVPLFESVVGFQNYPVDSRVREHRGSLRVSSVQISEQGNYPLSLQVIPGTQMILQLNYDRLRIDEDAIADMIERLQTLLADMAVDLKRPVSDYRIMTDEEREQVLFAWNQTAETVPASTSIHSL